MNTQLAMHFITSWAMIISAIFIGGFIRRPNENELFLGYGLVSIFYWCIIQIASVAIAIMMLIENR